jgi:hypothetical protein
MVIFHDISSGGIRRPTFRIQGIGHSFRLLAREILATGLSVMGQR